MRMMGRRPWWLAAIALLLGALAAQPAAAQNRFNFVNASGQTIEQLYVSPTRVNSWGPDVLGTGVLPPGQTLWVVPNSADCLLDLRVVYAGGREETRQAINTCRLTRITWGRSAAPGAVAGSRDPSFRFRNGAGITVNEVYVSLNSDPNWGADRLGQDVLNPGQTTIIRLPIGAGCRVDIRVVYANGQARERRGVETCSIEELNWR